MSLLSCPSEVVPEEDTVPDSGEEIHISYALPSEYFILDNQFYRALSSDVPVDFVYLNILEENHKFHHFTIIDERGAIDVPKDGFYIFAFTGREPVENFSLTGSRDISSSISVLGSLKIVVMGLDSLPLQEAVSDIDLGLLVNTGDYYESSLASASLEDSISYTAEDLEAYALFDNSLLKFMNPDINKNGIYDTDENIFWRLTALRRYEILSSDFDIENDDVNIPLNTFTNNTDCQLVFWHNLGIDHPPVEEVFLRFPENTTYYDKQDDIITGIYSHHGYPATGDADYQLGQYYFSLDSLVSSPTPPYNGDYVLSLGDVNYELNNLNFTLTTEYGADGFIFPLIEVDVGTDDIIHSVTYKWYKVQGGVVVPATDNEVHLQIFDFYFGFESSSELLDFLAEPETYRSTYYIERTLDVSEFQINIDTLNGEIGCNFWDRAETDNHFTIRF
ncbi:MAG: hypothetical protein JEY99_17715 [Spirochaetales bacterium]|nr:hypothetical protein [Spirochaetales bacterium]